MAREFGNGKTPSEIPATRVGGSAVEKMHQGIDLNPVAKETDPHASLKRPYTIRVGEEELTRDVVEISWGWDYAKRTMLTTHPDIVGTFHAEGLAGFPAGTQDGSEPTEILLVDLEEGKFTLPIWARNAQRVEHDTSNGLFTFHPPTEDIEVIESERQYYGPAKDFSPTRYEPTMGSIIEDFNLRYTVSNLYKEIPQVQEAFKNLGFNKSEDGSLTLPTPQELAARCARLRETDTSGIYYPEIQLVPSGSIDITTYLDAYGNKRHPIGMNRELYYKHDAVSEHMVAFMVYGEPLMDIMSRYVNIASAGEDYPNKLGSIGDIIDGHTDMLGGKSTEEAKNNEHAFFEKVVATLRDADELDNTQLIGWMRERDMVDTVDAINGKTILKGLSSYAQERFALPAAA